MVHFAGLLFVDTARLAKNGPKHFDPMDCLGTFQPSVSGQFLSPKFILYGFFRVFCWWLHSSLVMPNKLVPIISCKFEHK